MYCWRLGRKFTGCLPTFTFWSRKLEYVNLELRFLWLDISKSITSKFCCQDRQWLWVFMFVECTSYVGCEKHCSIRLSWNPEIFRWLSSLKHENLWVCYCFHPVFFFFFYSFFWKDRKNSEFFSKMMLRYPFVCYFEKQFSQNILQRLSVLVFDNSNC